MNKKALFFSLAITIVILIGIGVFGWWFAINWQQAIAGVFVLLAVIEAPFLCWSLYKLIAWNDENKKGC